QEVDNDTLFADVAVFRRTVSSPAQMPGLLELAVQSALQRRGVAVLTLPGDVGALGMPDKSPPARFVERPPKVVPDPEQLGEAQRAIDASGSVALLVGIGASPAREGVLALAEHLCAPMVLTLKAKSGLEHDNPFQVGQTGLIGNPAARAALEGADLLLML